MRRRGRIMKGFPFRLMAKTIAPHFNLMVRLNIVLQGYMLQELMNLVSDDDLVDVVELVPVLLVSVHIPIQRLELGAWKNNTRTNKIGL